MKNPYAFPCPAIAISGHDGEIIEDGTDGMTLRDYFAAKALAGLLSAPETLSALKMNAVEEGCSIYAYVADVAFGYADAMLRARNTQPSALSPKDQAEEATEAGVRG